MTETIPSTPEEFHWEQPPRRVPVKRADALAIATVVEINLRHGMELIPEWQLKIALLVTPDVQERTKMIADVENHNQKVRRYMTKHPELFPVSDTDQSLGATAVSIAETFDDL